MRLYYVTFDSICRIFLFYEVNINERFDLLRSQGTLKEESYIVKDVSIQLIQQAVFVHLTEISNVSNLTIHVKL